VIPLSINVKKAILQLQNGFFFMRNTEGVIRFAFTLVIALLSFFFVIQKESRRRIMLWRNDEIPSE
jgi:hypothetical protein